MTFAPLRAALRRAAPAMFHVKHSDSAHASDAALDVSRETFGPAVDRAPMFHVKHSVTGQSAERDTRASMFHVKHSGAADFPERDARASMFHVKHSGRGLRRPRALLAGGLAAFALLASACGGVQQPDGWAAPVQIEDRVLVQARTGQLSLIDPATGQPAWQHPQDDFGDRPFYATPVVDGDFVYLADYKGRVTRLDISGDQPQQSWVAELDAQLVATPLLRDGSLFVPTEDGDIAVLNASDGAVTRVIETSDRRIWSSPAANGGAIYVSDLDSGATLAFDASTGNEVWQQEATGASAADLVLEDGLLLVGSFDRSLHALNANGGEERWEAAGDGWFMARPLIHGDTVFAVTMRGSIYALDGDTGTERWSFTAEDDAEFRSAPAMVGGSLVVAARDGRVFALDPANGTLRWTVDTDPDGNVNADPLVDGSHIYYVTSEHDLVRVDAGNEGAFQAVPLAAAR